MASILGSFWSSGMSKRLLRYALSRVDLLDTDDLDMDKLDFNLGKNTVLTFQDIGLKLPKLERLLQLPPSFELHKAKVLQLRLVIPAAILTSPIIVQVDGVQVNLRVLSSDPDSSRSKYGSGKATSPETRHHETDDDDEVVPHAMDLAQSFLETQPSKEKEELEARLAAQSQDLGSSVASSEDGSDEDSQLGTGEPLSLPSFIADFLRGIVDRTQVAIKAVTFQLDVDVPLEPNSTAPEPVTFQLSIDDIDVEGVTTTGPAVEESDAHTIQYKEGKRHIGLNRIRACLISEANVFSAIARTPSMPSSAAASSPLLGTRKPMSAESSFDSQPSFRDHMVGSADLSRGQHHNPLMDSEDAFNIPYEMDGTSEHGDIENDDEGGRSEPSTPRALAPQSPFIEAPRAVAPNNPAQSAMQPSPELWASTLDRSVRSEPADRDVGRLSQHSTHVEPVDHGLLAPSTGEVTPSPSEELEQSQMFSHEDAQSMYMSALSDYHPAQSRPTMPGAWDDSDGVDSSQEKSPSPARDESSRGTAAPPADILHENIQSIRTHSIPEATAEASGEPSTPKGPTKLSKELISLDRVSIYVPSTHDHAQLPSGEQPVPSQFPHTSSGYMHRSIAPNIPGAFSVHAAAQSTASLASPPKQQVTPASGDNAIEVIISSLGVQCDLSTGFLLATVLSKLMKAFKEKTGSQRAQGKKAPQGQPTSETEIRLTAHNISLRFLEQLSGVADTAERLLIPSQTGFDTDALLMLTLENLKIGTLLSETSNVTSLDLGKFRFGYANDDIVSFDQRLQMRASVRDAFPTAGTDVSLSITQSSDTTRCEIKTLPLHIKLDLQRLDETFSWFGGLSGFLNMSSSATSNASPRASSPVAPSRKPRGVRFEAPIRPDDASASSENKMNVRVGGFHLDLIGKECSVALDTSAVKVVSRDEGLGVGISKIHLTGPVRRRSMGDAPINVVVTNTRIEYLPSPNDRDLERLLELIIPSKHKFDEGDDEIMVDTLLRQRRKGGVMRLNVDHIETNVSKLPDLQMLPTLGEEIGRLATVAKYLPEDDRPGILTLSMIHRTEISVDVGGKLGSVQAILKDFEIGQITVPSLVALGMGSVSILRNHQEELVGPAVPASDIASLGPSVTMRLIPDEMEPVIKLRMRNINIEYRVPTMMDILGLAEDTTPQEFEANLAASVANFGDHAHAAITGKAQHMSPISKGKDKDKDAKPTKVDLSIRDCLLSLNPQGLPSKLIVALTDAHFDVMLSKGDDAKAQCQLNKASILLINDVAALDSRESRSARRRTSNTSSPQVTELCQRGFVDICYISSAKASIKVVGNQKDGGKLIDVEVRDDLLVLETCADSTQTLIALSNALAPPTPPSREVKFKTEIMPVKDLLASISGDAFGKNEGDYDFDDDFGFAGELSAVDEETSEMGRSSHSSSLDVDSQFFDDGQMDDQLLEDPEQSILSEKTTSHDTNDGVLLTNFSSQPDSLDDEDDDLVIHENYFGTESVILGTAHRWNSTKNEYDIANDDKLQTSPVSVRVRDVHFIWNLFDGYDWDHTRDVISKAVYDIETTAAERQARHDRPTSSSDMEVVEEETVIGDFLFNSIYIGIPANRDPHELAQAINQGLNDNATETESIATTAMTATPSRQGAPYRTKKKLKLNRSKRHKIAFELSGVNVDLVTFPPGSGETQSSIDVRVKDLNVFDHVPTSTWKKFATYDQDAGEREMGTSMAHLEILNVKPQSDLAATEIVLKATFLPLRLHVDQDALDFITRFFEFKDDTAKTSSSPSDVPFVQRAEINAIPVKLDFKPKRVDYAGLRSGHTTEFMNFMILDEARMTLRHTIVYGSRGFDRLGKTLNDIWMPDVRTNQLPGILAGLAPVRSLVNVGSGFKELVEVPIREYKKDGRIVRSIGKGAAAFVKTTGTEVVKLGAKLAVGTQYALQGAEGLLAKPPDTHEQTGWEETEGDPEETKQISLYADQPTGVVQGLRGAYASMARDLAVARDAIIAVPGEVMEAQNAQGVAKAVLNQAPTIIFRPLIGSSKALGKTFMGATNSLDPHNRRRIDEKYKKH